MARAGAGGGRTAGDADAAARAAALLAELAALGSEESRAGMARYGINTSAAYGVSIYELRRVAKRFRRDHELALALWATGNHEARLLASMVDDPAQVTELLGVRLPLIHVASFAGSTPVKLLLALAQTLRKPPADV